MRLQWAQKELQSAENERENPGDERRTVTALPQDVG